MREHSDVHYAPSGRNEGGRLGVAESSLRECDADSADALRAALDRKYLQLGQAARLVLRRVAIFAGRFTLEAVSTVARLAPLQKSEIPECMERLQANSLVESQGQGACARYWLAENTRAYALTALAANGELNVVARLHAEYLQYLFEDAEVRLDRQVATQWVADYGGWLDDVRVALDWSFSALGDADIGVGLTVAAIPLWSLSSRADELSRRIERALESKAAATHSARELQLRTAARLAGMVQGELPSATRGVVGYRAPDGLIMA